MRKSIWRIKNQQGGKCLLFGNGGRDSKRVGTGELSLENQIGARSLSAMHAMLMDFDFFLMEDKSATEKSSV